jgi:hypothetical protein
MMIDSAALRNTVSMVSLTFALVISGCSEIPGVDDPLEYPDAVGYFEKPTFLQWWRELEACSKLSRSIDKVGFFYVPHETLPSALHGIRTVGLYFPQSNRIFVVEAEKSNRQVVRHEMMHALLRDESGHPPRYFGADGLCGYL